AIEYLGRLDHQVKLRGLRIELGEIEAGLRSYPGVREAVVLLRAGRLIGYVAGETQPDEAGLKQHLAALLPEYMVPSRLLWLEHLPLSANGKLDRKALPDPEWESDADSRAEPEGETELAIARIWQDVLGLARVSRHDDFFQLGGHSLAAMKVRALLLERHGQALPIRHFFDHPTLAGLAASLDLGPAEQRLDEMDKWMSELEDLT
ncbi:phosphopantetheine-binding protein, partial [Inquilinus sp. YAF38]|uniref:phosphopantetheine-binding protein n=1 Tax=Inquilinus sp. YAF38 TaxID=3233084 RepID=UPI003F91BF27